MTLIEHGKITVYGPEGELDLIRSEVDVIVYGEDGLRLYLLEREETIVETVPLPSDHLIEGRTGRETMTS